MDTDYFFEPLAVCNICLYGEVSQFAPIFPSFLIISNFPLCTIYLSSSPLLPCHIQKPFYFQQSFVRLHHHQISHFIYPIPNITSKISLSSHGLFSLQCFYFPLQALAFTLYLYSNCL